MNLVLGGLGDAAFAVLLSGASFRIGGSGPGVNRVTPGAGEGELALSQALPTLGGELGHDPDTLPLSEVERYARQMRSKAVYAVTQAAAAAQATPIKSEPESTAPNATWKKAEIQEWLESEGVEFDSGMTKAELLDLAK